MTRGFGDNRNGSIMRDGMPIVQGRGLNATVDRVEVLKGPASLLYGIQDPGGVVNMVSKKPELEQYNALTVRGSTYGDGKNGSGGSLRQHRRAGRFRAGLSHGAGPRRRRLLAQLRRPSRDSGGAVAGLVRRKHQAVIRL